MKTIPTTIIRNNWYLTADDAPAFGVAAQWLDCVQRYTGGIRGYGGPVGGQWLKLTRSQHENYLARLQYAETLGQSFPAHIHP